MYLHEIIQTKGCITQEKYIKGKSLTEIERILGFQAGRLRKGIVVAALQQIPDADEFDLLGYTQVAEHKVKADSMKDLDIDKLKFMVRQTVFTTVGFNRLVKVLPNIPHSQFIENDEQYPPGQGVPQWKLTAKSPAKVIAIVEMGERYY